MNGTVSVRPVGNILDTWDDMLRPFDPNEEERGNRGGSDKGKDEDNDETMREVTGQLRRVTQAKPCDRHGG